MKTKLTIVKIGGEIIDDSQSLNHFLADFTKLKGPKILIHGGGKIATEFSLKLGIESQMNEGRRITSGKDLEVVTMVYAGLINKNIISKLQSGKCNAIGLTGADANCLLASKRPNLPIDYGFVGDVSKVNSEFIQLLLSHQLTPVFCAITHDGNGQLLNTNADTIASEIAIAMSGLYETHLYFCFEKQGVLLDKNNESSLIKNINLSDFNLLKTKKIIQEGMLPKMENSFYALKNHVGKVIIGNAKCINPTEKNFTQLIL